jgi:hypothetical protein
MGDGGWFDNIRIIYIIKEARMASAQPCPPPDYTCIWFLGVHGTVMLQVNETILQQSKSEEVKPEMLPLKNTSLLQSLPQVRLTAFTLGSIGIDGGLTGYIAPSNLGYSVMGSENSQFAQYIDAFINMAERSNISGSHRCLTGREIAHFFNSFDKEMYSYFDNLIKSKLQDLQTRFLGRAPQDPKELETVDFTQKFVTFAPDEMLKSDFNTRMQESRTSAGLYWREHHSCISEKLYCPGTHANQCSFYFPGVDDTLRGRLALKLNTQKRKQGPVQQSVNPKADEEGTALSKGLSIDFSSDLKAVLTITFENDPSGFVKNVHWKGIPLNTFFEQIKRYLNYMFEGVEGFDLKVLMSRTCVIDTACANFSVPVPGQHVSIIGFDNAASSKGASGTSMLIDIHNDPTFEMGWWERMIMIKQPSVPHAGAGAGAVTHSIHSVIIPRDLVSYVPSGLVCNTMIKSVEPIFEPATGRIVSVVYTYHDGHQETIAREPQMLGAAGAATTVARFTESMEGVYGEGSPLRDNMSISDDDVLELGGGRSLGRRKLLRNMRRGRSLRNKRKTKRDRKIRGLGVRPTRRKRTGRTLRRR